MKKLYYLLILLLLQLFLLSPAMKNYSPQALTLLKSVGHHLQNDLTANAATDKQAVFHVGNRPYTANESSTDTYGINTATVEQALFEQINNDRAQMGLNQVEWDETAAIAARKHANELAQNNYIAHWNLQGKKPQQRYREAGGLYCTSENVGYAWFKGYTLAQDLVLKNTLKIHAEMMAEVPPDDGHRKNILEPHHTHVGVGLAYAVKDDGSITIAFTQEFSNHYVDLTGVPLYVMPGGSFTISGKIQKAGVKPESVVLLWEEAPTPMTESMLKATHSYSSPDWSNMVSYALENWPQTYYPNTKANGSKFKLDNNGNFTATLTTSKATGLNYLQVCLKDSQGEIFVANELVIEVHK